MKPKKFINSAADAVDEFISGLLIQYPNHLRKLKNHHVILHSSFATDNAADVAHPNKTRVSLLSGGGSGHEPSHAGYVGKNMLSGAILGGIFASPSVNSILAAIRAATLPTSEGGMGCLLIVKNYTGDRLNFGMACELAIAEGRAVKMVVVADDCAIERKKGITGARGVAGTVLVHKAAGGAAGRGMDLDQVLKIAETVSMSIGSLGVALNTVTIPGAETVNDRLSNTNEAGEPMMEIGLGIHGEAGMRQCPLLSCDDIAKEMLKTIQSYGREVDSKIVPLYNPGDELIVLVNNLGGTSNFELSLLTRSLVTLLEEAGCKATRVLVGSFMTSFDMQGASVSVMPLTGDISKDVLSYIDENTNAPAWLAADIWIDGDCRPSASEIEEVIPAKATSSDDAAKLPLVIIKDYTTVARTALAQCAQALSDAEPTLTKYDTIVGDGDCGITMQRGAKEVLARLESNTLRVDNPVNTFSDLADAVSASMGGSSGILLELMFRKVSTSLQSVSGEGIAFKDMTSAFRSGCDAVSFYGGAQEGSRTMLDSMFPASAAMVAGGTLQDAAIAAQKGVDATAAMGIAEAGRSNYLSADVLTGTPDPGAVAVSIVLEALAKAVVQ